MRPGAPVEVAETGGGGARRVPDKLNGYALACSAVASMISIIFGYDVGVMSGAMIFIQEEFHVSDHHLEVLAGILNICALFGSLMAGRTSDYLGRRYTIMLAAIIFMLGSIFMGWGPNYAVLITGRCIAGFGVGFALMIAPVYTAEIAAAHRRGFLSSLPEIGISLGILSGYLSNYIFANLSLKLGWRIMLGIAAIPSLFLAIGILWMPESPRWLMMKGRAGKSKKILYMVCNTKEEAELRLRDIKRTLHIDEDSTGDVVEVPKTEGGGVIAAWKELFVHPSPAIFRMLVAGVGVHFFEHITGIEAVILYGPRIFQKAGVKSKEKLLLATVGVGLTKLTFITISTFILDKVGRRTLLLISVSGMTFTMAALGTCLTIIENTEKKLLILLVLCLVFVYSFLAFFNIGICPVCWVYSAEIFPLRVRAVGVSLSVATNRLMNAVVSMTFLSLSAAITIGGSFFAFSGMSVLAWIFVYFCMPETKGRSLEEMEELFSKGVRARKKEKQAEMVET